LRSLLVQVTAPLRTLRLPRSRLLVSTRPQLIPPRPATLTLLLRCRSATDRALRLPHVRLLLAFLPAELFATLIAELLWLLVSARLIALLSAKLLALLAAELVALRLPALALFFRGRTASLNLRRALQCCRSVSGPRRVLTQPAALARAKRLRGWNPVRWRDRARSFMQ
jgi:hypothetical protein